MIAIFISFFIVVLSFNFFVISYQINGINRLVLSAPISLFETAINLFEIDEDIGPVFDKTILVSCFCFNQTLFIESKRFLNSSFEEKLSAFGFDILVLD